MFNRQLTAINGSRAYGVLTNYMAFNGNSKANTESKYK